MDMHGMPWFVSGIIPPATPPPKKKGFGKHGLRRVREKRNYTTRQFGLSDVL